MPKTYCTKCRTNWAALHSQDDDNGDESYDFCPVCKSDSFLQDFKENEDAFLYSLNGQKVNVKTGRILKNAITLPLISRKTSSLPYNKEDWEKREEAKDIAQEKRINEYIANCEKYGKEEAERIYFNTPLLATYDIEVKAIIVQ